ncbi:MAG: cyclic nucleotide-binding domain-containing protein [Gammaproteobacteria bacterium]|nr:cyclic nucleotide-binding domain-containing protein [Gammaproteobacteria bacterium]
MNDILQKLDKQFFMSSMLLFLSVASIIINYTYLNALFLSHYPKSFLPYLYASQSIIVVLFLLLTGSLQKSSRNIVFASEVFIVVAVMVFFVFLLRYDWRWSAFVFCSLLLSAEALIGTIAWIVVTAAYDIREFKVVGKWLNVFGNIGGIVGGLLSAWFVDFLGMTSLLFLSAIMLIFMGFLIIKHRRVPQLNRIAKHRHSAFSYPLFRGILCYTIVASFIYTIIDYSFKANLMQHFGEKGIGEFMGIFFTVATILTVISQFTGTKTLINKYGPASLLMVMPIFWVLSAFGVIAYPGLVMATIFGAGWLIFNYSYTNLGVQLGSNVLPAEIKQMSKFFLKAVAFPVGLALGALFLWATSGITNDRIIAIVVIFSIAIFYYFVKVIGREYHKTLEDTIIFKHLIDGDEFAAGSAMVMEKAAMDAINSNDIENKKFGLSLLRQYHITSFPSAVFDLLSSQDVSVKLLLMDLIVAEKLSAGFKRVLELLKDDVDERVLGCVLATLSHYPPAIGVVDIKKYLRHRNPAVNAGACVFAVMQGCLQNMSKGAAKLADMASSRDSDTRYYAAKAISKLDVAGCTREIVKLIRDKDDKVSIMAMEAALNKPVQKDVVIATVEQLLVPERSYCAVSNLIVYGDCVVPFLREKSQVESFSMKRNIARCLILLDSDESRKLLLEIYDEGDIVMCRFIANEMAIRAVKQSLNSHIKDIALHYVQQQVFKLCALYNMQTSFEAVIENEIQSRISVAKEICLYWFAICTEARDVLQLIPIITKTELLHDDEALASALELLTDFAVDVELQDAVKVIESNVSLPGRLHAKYYDICLDRVMCNRDRLFDRVVTLRQTVLFKTLLLEYLLYIAEHLKEVKISKGDVVFKEGDDAGGVFIISSGSVSVVKGNNVLVELVENQEFGEMALLSSAKRFATVRAAKDTTLLYLDKITFDHLIGEIPDLLRATVQTVLFYLRENLKRG